jgi:hypothetical protein
MFALFYDTARATMRRRWQSLLHPRAAIRWRIWIAVMALLVLLPLPLPLGNLLPGFSLVLLGLGWSFKYGLVLMLSLVSGTAATGYVVLSVHALQLMFESIFAWWA